MSSQVGVRYRLVTTQDGHEHVSSVVLGADEVEEYLDLETEMHRRTGWTVEQFKRYGSEHGFLVCWKNGQKQRTLEARAFGPMEDA